MHVENRHCLKVFDPFWFLQFRVLTPIISVYTIISGTQRFKSRCSKGSPYTSLFCTNKEQFFQTFFLIYMLINYGLFPEMILVKGSSETRLSSHHFNKEKNVVWKKRLLPQLFLPLPKFCWKNLLLYSYLHSSG